VRQAQEALAQAEQRRKDAEIRSPIDGVIVTRQLELGQAVLPGMVLFKIVNNSVLVADVDLPEKTIGAIEIGTPAEITVDAFPDGVFSGRVTAVNPMVNPRIHTFTARVEISNSTGKLVDGLFCRARFLTGTRSALAVPRESLLRNRSTGGDYVFLIKEGKAVKRPVRTGIQQDLYVEVTEGLEAGDTVVTGGTGRVLPGTIVEIQNVEDGQGRQNRVRS
jgi:RND family efflux transporter MFP subunit